MLDLIWLIPALPLLGFLILVVFGRRLGDPRAGYLASALLAGSFVVTVVAFFDLLGTDAEERTHVVDAVRVAAGRRRCRSTWPSSPTR